MLFNSCFVLLLLILGKETNGGGEDKTRKRKRLSCSIFGSSWWPAHTLKGTEEEGHWGVSEWHEEETSWCG